MEEVSDGVLVMDFWIWPMLSIMTHITNVEIACKKTRQIDSSHELGPMYKN